MPAGSDSTRSIGCLSPAPDNRPRRAALGTALLLAIAVGLGACGDGGGGGQRDAATGEAIEHIHGLGVNPADGSLYIATHNGLFRSSEGSPDVERVGSSSQDTMGFTVVGPDRFLGSGHPGPDEDGPPNLGLIESSDAGQTWEEVSLGGEADFHVLRYAHDRVYAVNALTGLVMLSDDGGETWTERRPGPPAIDLAVDPEDSGRMIASTELGLAISEDDGRSWQRAPGDVGLVAWPAPNRLYLVNATGEVQVSEDGAQDWRPTGKIGGQPAALTAVSGSEVYAALADGTVLQSADGTESWDVRVQP